MLVDQVRRRLAVSERALRLFRAACGVLVMLECAERWPVLRAFYSDAGALPRWAVLPTREEDPVRSGLGPSPISPQPRPSHPPSHPPTTSQWPLNDNPTRTGTDFFSLSLNVAPPLLPYVQNLIQKKKQALWAVCIHAWSGALQWQQLLVLVEATCALCLACNWRPRIATAACWYLHLSITLRCPPLVYILDRYMHLILFYGILTPRCDPFPHITRPNAPCFCHMSEIEFVFSFL